jgi:tetratricopeptide (TPR) repeat protein
VIGAFAAAVVMAALLPAAAAPPEPAPAATRATEPAPAAPGPGPLAGRSYLVLPFENVAEEASLGWMSTGLALALGEYLEGSGARVMDDEERAVLLEGNGIPVGAGLSLGSALDLGRKARERAAGGRPDRLVIGRFEVHDGTLTLQARLVALPDGKARPWASRAGRLKDLLDVQEELALVLLEEEGVRGAGRSASVRRQRVGVPLLAFETYCRAMAETDSRKRLQALRRAVQEFPGYPKAAYQAAALLAKEERWSEAQAMLERSSDTPHPYEEEFHLLAAAVALGRGDAERAAEEARRALSFGESARGRVLLARALLALGERDGARAALEAARAADPSDPEIEEVRRAVEGGPATRRQP